jgi:methylated-DNA-[protein]-cysteine S-methyltransferase
MNDDATLHDLREQLAQRATTDGLVALTYDITDSPIGALLVAVTEAGVVRVAFASEDHEKVLCLLAERISPRLLRSAKQTDQIRRELNDYLTGSLGAFTVPIDWQLINGFQRDVLGATARLRYGTTASYGDIATAAGNPRAVRAAGTALGRNPIPIMIPCHRVLRADGSLGGYLGGLDAKRFLLTAEQAA